MPQHNSLYLYNRKLFEDLKMLCKHFIVNFKVNVTNLSGIMLLFYNKKYNLTQMIYIFYAHWLEKIILELLSYLMAFWLNTHADSAKKEERNKEKEKEWKKKEREGGGRKKEGIKERKNCLEGDWRVWEQYVNVTDTPWKFGWMYSLTFVSVCEWP